MLKIELLYFDGCPSWKVALENFRLALVLENLSDQIRLVEIKTLQQAQTERFLGSPSFRINGDDLWPVTISEYLLNCRVYPTHQGLHGSPTVEMFREQIRLLLT